MEACLSIKFAYLDWLTCKKCLLGGHGKARRTVTNLFNISSTSKLLCSSKSRVAGFYFLAEEELSLLLSRQVSNKRIAAKCLATGKRVSNRRNTRWSQWPVLCICRFDTMTKLANKNGQPPSLSASLDNSKTRYNTCRHRLECTRHSEEEVLTAGHFVYLRLFLFARLLATAPKI